MVNLYDIDMHIYSSTTSLGISKMQSTSLTKDQLPESLYEAVRTHSQGRHGAHPDDEDEDLYDSELDGYSQRRPHRQSLGPLQSTSSYIGEDDDNRWIECVPHKHAILDQEMSIQREMDNQEVYNQLLSGMQTFRYQNP